MSNKLKRFKQRKVAIPLKAGGYELMEHTPPTHMDRILLIVEQAIGKTDRIPKQILINIVDGDPALILRLEHNQEIVTWVEQKDGTFKGIKVS